MPGYLTREPIGSAALVAAVSGPEQGGIATFVGLVRDHQDGRAVLRLEYSAYEPMAEAEGRWPAKVALCHRVGELTIGEIAVVVVAGSAHRGPAFDACRYVIEEVKRRVPIWKKEFYADGTVAWVDPTAHGPGAWAAGRVSGASR